MVPDKFNMVDMEGIDIITSQGEVVEGLYQKLVESITQCRYQCLYNWKFNGILIPPTYVEMTIIDDVVWINEGVSVDEEDVIRIYSLEPEPRLLALAVSANGDYLPPEEYDGFSSVNVAVPEPVFGAILITENGYYTPGQGIDGFFGVTVNVPGAQVGTDPPSSDFGNVGDYYIQEVPSTEIIFGITITKAARDQNQGFNYWGAKEIQLVFEDEQENLVYFRNLVSASCQTATGTGNFSNAPSLIDGNTGSYYEVNGLPGYIRLSAVIPSNLKLVKLGVWARSDSWKDYWVDFKLAQWSEDRVQVGSDILARNNMVYSDWVYGDYTEFPINYTPVRVSIPYLYQKTSSGWVLVK